MRSIKSSSILARAMVSFAAVLMLTGCAGYGAVSVPPWVDAVAGDGPGDARSVKNEPLEIRNLPKSERGNPPVYRVFGETYKVLDTAEDFKEWGVASWYGKKFHGRETSSGEIYDMHMMTAAHKHLPIPTFAMVTRVDTGKSIIVKINDRGPFVGDRVIDLSYAAALELDMVESGKADVYIEALTTHHVRHPLLSDPLEYSSDQQSAMLAAEPSDVAYQESISSDVFIQVGAFSKAPNAERMVDRVRQAVDLPVGIDHDARRELHLVRVGPMPNEMLLEDALNSLTSAGIDNFTFVTINP